MPDEAVELEDIADKALKEINRRFTDSAAEIPDHVLAKYFTDINKTIDRRTETEEGESQPFSLLDELDTFPLARAHELAEAERERFLAEARALDEWMLANPVSGPDVSEVEPGAGADEPDDGAGWRAVEVQGEG